MYFALFLNLEGLNYYGHIPEIPKTTEKVILYELKNGWDDADLFADDLDEIDDRCNALIDCGDVDYLNSAQCALLEAWIEERLRKQITPRYQELLEVLMSFCHRAVELNTGLLIDL